MYKLQTSDLANASVVLGDAFKRYPVFEYVIPDFTQRKKQLKYFCNFILGLGIRNGDVIAPSASMEGVSIWLQSTGADHSGIDAIRAGLLNLFFQTDIGTFSRFIAIGRIKGARRRAIVKGPYCLCEMIGVNPLYQRRGFGRRMIERRLIDCDQANMPCYLETSEAANIDYHKRYGFALVDAYRIKDVSVYCMLREPNACKRSPDTASALLPGI